MKNFRENLDIKSRYRIEKKIYRISIATKENAFSTPREFSRLNTRYHVRFKFSRKRKNSSEKYFT